MKMNLYLHNSLGLFKINCCNIFLFIYFRHNDWICMLCRDVLTFPVPEEDAKRKLIDLQGRELMVLI